MEEPTLTDVVVAACRRVKAYLDDGYQAGWSRISDEAIELSRCVPCGPWKGGRLDLERYSGSQERELEIRGVSGALDLPRGPDQLWPLLAASQWIHVGKSTNVGLGQIEIRYGVARGFRGMSSHESSPC